LGFYPDNIAFYQLAVRHRSMTPPTNHGHVLSNERLEFLGDAVLNSVVTDILFNRFESQREGFLTNTRSKIVKREFLNQLAKEIGLDKLVVKSRNMGNSINGNIYGNAFEALIGAIYLDYGYKKCKRFVEKRLFRSFVDLEKIVDDETNYKSRIIELCQKNHLPYEFILLNDTQKNANNHIFQVRLVIGVHIECEATGNSKKEAHQNASLKAFQLINENPALLIQQSEEIE
jgi:ribonuclease-3